MLNGELASSTKLDKAVANYNMALDRGRYLAGSQIQAAFIEAALKGEKKSQKLAPNMAEAVFDPLSVSNEKQWANAILKQSSKAMTVRVLEKTRVNAARNLVDRTLENESLIGSWTTEHYRNFQNNMNAAIRRAENTGKPVNMREVASRAIVEGTVPPNTRIRNRAKLIARDQTQKHMNALNRSRSADLGAEHYQWRSVKDSRVRDEHELYNGKYFNKQGREVYANGDIKHGGINTKGEQPGDAVQCRCSAAWVLF